MDEKQLKTWEAFVSKLSQLDKNFRVIQGHSLVLTKTLEWYKNQTERLPFSFDFEKMAHYKRVFQNYSKAKRSLNNALALSQSGYAFLTPSENYPGDLDLVADKKKVSESEIKAATFFRPDLPTEKDMTMGGVFLAPVVPLLIKGAIFIGGATIISGIVRSVNESDVAQSRIQKEIIAIQAKVESEISKNPSLFEKWANYKKQTLEPAAQTFWGSLGEKIGSGLGPALGIIIVAAVGLYLFKSAEKRK